MELKEQALNLYKIAFPSDPADFAADFINRFFENSCLYTVKDEKLVSMLFLLNANITFSGKIYGAYYLYAAATHPDFRSSGLMANLIEKAKEKCDLEGKFLVTKPAETSLYSYYERFGFETAFFAEEKEISLNKTATPLLKITKREYIEKREQLLKNTPHLTLNDMPFALSFFTLLGDENTVAAVDLSETPPRVKEFISKTESGTDKLLCAINKKSAIFTLSGNTPFAMLIHPKTLKTPKNIHFGLALD